MVTDILGRWIAVWSLGLKAEPELWVWECKDVCLREAWRRGRHLPAWLWEIRRNQQKGLEKQWPLRWLLKVLGAKCVLS